MQIIAHLLCITKKNRYFAPAFPPFRLAKSRKLLDMIQGRFVQKARIGVLSMLLLSFILLSATENVYAQGSARGDAELFADHKKTSLEAELVDSILSSLNRGVSDPAEEFYDSWNTATVHAYADADVPESFNIDVSQFVMPIVGHVTSSFGYRSRFHRMHRGTDIALHKGDTVRAAFDGKVRVRTFDRRGYGYYLVVRHPNGLETVYGHLSGFLVGQNETVEAGQPIGLGGNTGRSTGSHLHFEFRFLGIEIDPEEIIDFNAMCIKDDYYTFSKANSANNSEYTASNSHTDGDGDGKVQYYRVRKGESLYSISRKIGVSVERLRALNNIKKGAVLSVGRPLRIF